MIQPIKQVKWRSLVSEQEESGQSVAAFCRARGLPESLFYYWKKRLEKERRHRSWKCELAQPHLSPRRSGSAAGSND